MGSQRGVATGFIKECQVARGEGGAMQQQRVHLDLASHSPMQLQIESGILILIDVHHYLGGLLLRLFQTRWPAGAGERRK